MFIHSNKAYRVFSFYALSIIVSSAILLAALYTHGFHLNTPAHYNSDNLVSGVIVKSVNDVGLSFQNPYLGAPLPSDSSDYPLSENANLIIVKLLSLGSSHYMTVMNAFFLLTFPLTTGISLFTFRRLGLNKPFAFAASLLFTFVPYHFLRMEIGHLFLIAIYVIPIYVFLIFSVLTKPLFFGARDTSDADSVFKRIAIFVSYILVCIFAASSGVYYSFFAAYFMLIAGVMASVERKKWFPLLNASAFILLISVTLLLNTLPASVSRMKQGPNSEVAQRSPAESEYYGLKITQLLLPIDKHRIKALANFKERYNTTAPLVNGETRTASLGLIGSIGFLSLLFVLLLRKVSFISGTLFALSRFNIGAVLLSTIGGMGALFAYSVTPMIRGYTRMSVYIAFFSLAAFFLILQKILKNRPRFITKKTRWLIAMLIVAIGLFDQLPRLAFSDGKAQFESDAKFIGAIETKMPAGTMIMQLPYMDFPESPGLEGMESYSLFRGYLHSHQLRWSFGSMRGRNVAQWQKSVVQKPTQDMLNDLVYAGFTGLYIDRKGYHDHGLEIEQQITSVLHQSPTFINDTNDLAFYDLRPYVETLRASMPLANWQAHIASITQFINLNLKWGQGLYELEQAQNTSWHWSQQESKLEVIVSNPIKAKLKFTIKTGYPESSHLWISGDLLQKTIDINQAGTGIEQDLLIPSGKHYIYFKTDAKQVNSGADPRKLFFAIYDFSLA